MLVIHNNIGWLFADPLLFLGYRNGLRLWAVAPRRSSCSWNGAALHGLLVMAVDMSHRLGWIDDTIVKRVFCILQKGKLPTQPPEMMTVEKFKSVMAYIKEIEKARRDLRALIASKNCAPIMLRLA
ncbi:hypothetical protein BHM03_00025442 [Ensete ventricosum]|nr:hypothetical protein BHM03_00025442 [Ensete ventricosum]